MSLDNLLNTAPKSPSRDSFVEGQCHSVSPDGMMFTVNDWDGGAHVFGPAPWPNFPGATPANGDRVLAMFLGVGVGTPWVLSWWP